MSVKRTIKDKKMGQNGEFKNLLDFSYFLWQHTENKV